MTIKNNNKVGKGNIKTDLLGNKAYKCMGLKMGPKSISVIAGIQDINPYLSQQEFRKS